MTKVQWPSRVATNVQVWRVLDLAGYTSSVRQSKGYTRAGFVFVDGNRVNSLRDTIPMNKEITLELRFPNGNIRSASIMVIPRMYWPGHKQRSNTPTTLNRKG